jgi:hypothetical protein
LSELRLKEISSSLKESINRQYMLVRSIKVNCAKYSIGGSSGAEMIIERKAERSDKGSLLNLGPG